MKWEKKYSKEYKGENMKDYQEIYEKIENPLNDDEVIKKLIEGYSDELGTK